MAPVPPASGPTAQALQGHPPRGVQPRRAWLGPLLVGFTFALGYGITDRLLRLNLGGWVPLGQNFDHRPAPGTTLESLRQRSGDAGGSVRGDLETLAEQEALKRQEAEERERQQQIAPDPAAPAAQEPGASEADGTAGQPLPADTAPAAPPARPASPAPARTTAPSSASPPPARIPASPGPVPPP